MDKLKEIELGIKMYNYYLKHSSKMLSRYGVVQCLELRSELIEEKQNILKCREKCPTGGGQMKP